MTGTALVGYDGSETARAALAYAAQRVGSGGRVVVAHIVAPPTAFIDTQYYDESLRRARESLGLALGLEAKYYLSEEIDNTDASLDAYALMLTLGFSR